jgi:hypothetical protein
VFSHFISFGDGVHCDAFFFSSEVARKKLMKAIRSFVIISRNCFRTKQTSTQSQFCGFSTKFSPRSSCKKVETLCSISKCPTTFRLIGCRHGSTLNAWYLIAMFGVKTKPKSGSKKKKKKQDSDARNFFLFHFVAEKRANWWSRRLKIANESQ